MHFLNAPGRGVEIAVRSKPQSRRVVASLSRLIETFDRGNVRPIIFRPE
jgi:hypothetical protein